MLAKMLSKPICCQ